ncbi:MAG: acetyl-CoA carboxylase biotin carboxyl carrier protein [Planctomycetaceae bacterium]|nr:acetyl-CoA carboxylase biotin carboxyl carrier protein [Planctomycetaceae bacterium]
MSEKDKSVGDSFDLDRLKQLIRLMEKHDLTEVRLQGGDQKWVLRRGAQASSAAGPWGPAAVAYPAMPPATPAAPTNPSTPRAETAADAGLIEIKSPTVGTFYSRPQPSDPPFVKVGDRVSPDTVVCIIEAMKVFNQIPAETSGTIVKQLVNDGDAVEFGQPLFQVNPG